ALPTSRPGGICRCTGQLSRRTCQHLPDQTVVPTIGVTCTTAESGYSLLPAFDRRARSPGNRPQSRTHAELYRSARGRTGSPTEDRPLPESELRQLPNLGNHLGRTCLHQSRRIRQDLYGVELGKGLQLFLRCRGSLPRQTSKACTQL